MTTASTSARINTPNDSSGRALVHKQSASVSKRLQNEFMKLVMEGSKCGVSACPDGDNLFHMIATIKAADGTVYEGMTYKLSMSFPQNYPYSAPTVKFVTPCFHPNVDTNGNICLDILKEEWSAIYNILSILVSIQSLLGEPNNNSPLNPYAAQLWDNQIEYRSVLLKKNSEAFESK